MEKKKVSLSVSRIVGAACLLVSVGALAQSNPNDIIKYRQNVMKANGAHMAAIAAIIQGKVPFKNQLAGHVKAVQAEAHNIKFLFPKGSDAGDTKAKEAVWKNRAEFDKRANEAAAKADAFAKAVAMRDTKVYPARFKALAETCKTCHKDFRQAENQ